MKLIDVSVPLRADLPTYPGNTPFSLEPKKRIAQGDSSNVSTLHLSAHAGTHVDAPRHFFDAGPGAEGLALDVLCGRTRVVELTARRDRIKEDVDRIRGLVERNVSSRVAFDEKATQLREYDARLAAQRDRIADLELRAPMDGVVLRRDGEVGEIAGTANNDVLLWVGQPKPLRVVADVNEEDIIKVEPGQKRR